MSGNAALAAARRRRNPVEVPEVHKKTNSHFFDDSMIGGEALLQNYLSSSDVNENGLRVNKTSQAKNIQELVLEHDKLLFVLERKIDKLVMESTDPNKSGGLEELESYTRTTNSEIKLMKSTLQKQQKSLQDLTSLVTSLRATISNQNNTITELTEQLSDTKMSEKMSEDIDSKASSTVKLDISDTQ